MPPARVLRNDVGPPPLRYTTIYGVAAAAVTGLLYVLFGDFELIAYLLVGTVATFFVLYFAGRLLVLALAALARRCRHRVALRHRERGATRPGEQRASRRFRHRADGAAAAHVGTHRAHERVAGVYPEGAPNHFLINIQPAERAGIAQALADVGVAAPEFTPLVRARISHINGLPVAQYEAVTERGRDELEDETNLTWSAEVPVANTLARGEWWAADAPLPELSLEEELRTEIGLQLGDEITYAIGGDSLTVRLTNTRDVQWDSFRPNFFMVVSPGAIEQFAHTYITSLHVEPTQRAVTVDLVRRFPSVSVLDIGAVLDQVRRSMDRAALAVQYVFLFTLAAGVMVLLAAIQATRDERCSRARYCARSAPGAASCCRASRPSSPRSACSRARSRPSVRA